MEIKVRVRNLPKSTSEEELNALFKQAGEVAATEIFRDRLTGESRGFAVITMSVQSEADKAVSMFNLHRLGDQVLMVNLAKPREQRGFANLDRVE